MAPSPGYQSRLDLTCEPSAARYARSHTRAVLQKWGVAEEITGDALTIVSELVANAVRHAGREAEPDDPADGRPKARTCGVSLCIARPHLYIAVHDESRQPPVRRPAADDSESGRGLELVAALSEGEWGWASPAALPGKLVWACLRLPQSSTGSPSSSSGQSIRPGRIELDESGRGGSVTSTRRSCGTRRTARRAPPTSPERH
jgi:serine/threonine-protein kinase RsbW